MKNLLIIISVFFVQYSYASDIITWESLKPSQNQYQSISPDDKALLNEIYAYEVVQQTRQLSPMEKDGYNQRVALAEKFGLNVRELLKQRDRAQQETNSNFNNLTLEDIKLAGYLIPLEMEGLMGTQFILVPTAGACIHTPPPPANQIVLINFPEGYELQSLYTPVWVEGDIKAESISASVTLSDGNQGIQTGYVIDASDIEKYK